MAAKIEITPPQITKRMPAKSNISAVLFTSYAENPSFTIGKSEPHRSIVRSASQTVLFLLIAHAQNHLAHVLSTLQYSMCRFCIGDGKNLIDRRLDATVLDFWPYVIYKLG